MDLNFIIRVIHNFAWWNYRADSRFVPCQEEMSLKSHTISHWLGTNLKSSLNSMWEVKVDDLFYDSFQGNVYCTIHCFIKIVRKERKKQQQGFNEVGKTAHQCQVTCVEIFCLEMQGNLKMHSVRQSWMLRKQINFSAQYFTMTNKVSACFNTNEILLLKIKNNHLHYV